MNTSSIPTQPQTLHFHDTVKMEEEVDDCKQHPEVFLSDDEFWKWAEEEARKIRALIKENQPQ